MRGNISKDIIVSELLDIPLNDNILHTSIVAGLSHCEAAEPPWSDVASQEQGVVGVRGADARNSDTRLGKDLVDGECDNILGFNSMNFMPFAIT